MKEYTCCFSGHRNIPSSQYDYIKKRTIDGINYLVLKQGVTEFITGGALGYDTIAATCVLELKKYHPYISLHLALPCREQADYWSLKDKMVYKKILKNADSVHYISEHYHKGCMHQRNTYMVSKSNFCICYLTETTGGTAFTVNLARKSGLTVFNIAK